MVHTDIGRKGSDRALTSDEIKNVELEILKAFDVFSQKHNLRYWLFYGTLLGAARHQGFIPWDDDIDIVMPKDDYYKLIDLTNKGHAIGDYYRFSSASVKGSIAAQPFGKIFDTRTRAIENELVPIKGLDEGLWVDVFPLIGVDEHSRIEKATYVKAFDLQAAFLRRASLKFTPGDSLASTLRRLLSLIPARIAGVSHWASKCEHIQEDAPNMFDKPLCMQASNSKFTYPTNAFLSHDGEPSYLLFEGHLFPVPAKWDMLLQCRYGNWKELPPEAERISNHDLEAYWK